MEKIKKIPMRKCLGCMQSFPKNELIRVVRTPEGEICITHRFFCIPGIAQNVLGSACQPLAEFGGQRVNGTLGPVPKQRYDHSVVHIHTLFTYILPFPVSILQEIQKIFHVYF